MSQSIIPAGSWNRGKRKYSEAMGASIIQRNFRRRRYNPSRVTLASKVNRLIRNQEKKYLDTTLAASVIAIGGNLVTNVSIIPQGDTATTRDGSQVNYISLQAAFEVSNVVNAYRVVYVLDTQPGAAAATAADVFEAPTLAASPLNITNRLRFKVLFDNYGGYERGFYNIENSGTAAKHPCKFFRKLDIMATFVTAAGGSGASSNNQILQVILAGRSAVTVDSYTRLRFIDS